MSNVESLYEIIRGLMEENRKLDERNAELCDRLLELQTELAASRPLSGAERSQRWRNGKRHERDENATENVTQTSRNVTDNVTENERVPNGPLGVSPPEPPFPVTPLNPPKAREPQASEERFEVFWKTYPRSENGSKAKAREVWKRLTVVDGEAAIAGARNYANSKHVIEGFVQHQATWLRGRNWEVWQEVPSENGHDDNADQRQFRLKLVEDLVAHGMDREKAESRAGLRPMEAVG